MIKYLIVLLLILSVAEACQPQVNKVTDETSNLSIKTTSPAPEVKDTTSSLPIPYPKYLIISDPATVTVRWDPVTVSKDNPILGFKIKLWEDKKKKVIKYVERDGEQVMIEELVPIKKSFHVLPTHKPAYVAVVPPDVFTARFDVKIGEHYELRGQSFNADGDGPLSNTYGFKINPNEKDVKSKGNETEVSDWLV